MKKRGFTMVELLVVIAIIAVLAGIVYPLSKNLIGNSRAAACLGNLRSLAVALQTYLQEHNNRMPDLLLARKSKTEEGAVLETELLPYLQSAEAFHCPADHIEFERSGSSYLWNSTQSGRLVSELKFLTDDRPDKIPLITDKDGSWHPGGTNMLYADMTETNKPRFATSD